VNMSFGGNTDSSDRNAVQKQLAENIGNPSTLSRSVDLAIQIESVLFTRSNNSTGTHYTTYSKALLEALKHPQSGMHTQQRLLVGALRPALWAEEVVPIEKKKKKEDVPKEPEKKREKNDYYFFKSTPKEQAAQYAPRPLDAPQSSTPQPIVVAAAVSSAPSAWNTGGTWEERNLTPFTLARVKELLEIALNQFNVGGTALSFSSIKVEGNSQLVLVRGKKRLGFELNINADFSGTHDEEKVEGKFVVPSVDLSEAEAREFTIEVSVAKPQGGAARSQVVGVAGADIKRRIMTALSEFVPELRARSEE